MMPEIQLGMDPQWSAEGENVIGPKVIDPLNFRAAVYMAIVAERWERISVDIGSRFYRIRLPESSLRTVSCGWGTRSNIVADYHLRFEQGRVEKFLHREHSLPSHYCTVTVRAPWPDPGPHLLVSLDVGSEGLPPPLSTRTFFEELCQGETDLCWGENDCPPQRDLDKIREKCLNVMHWNDTFSAVADPKGNPQPTI